MSQLTLKKKRDLGNGNFEYTFECACVPKPVKQIVLVYGNDNEAHQDAQEQCDEYCQGLG
jgi:hypothetical protein